MNFKLSHQNKILLVIDSYQQYQTYLRTRALEEIKDRVVFLIDSKLAKVDFGVSGDKIFKYDYPAKKDLFYRHIFNMSTTLMSKRHSYWFRTEWHTKRQKRIYKILSLPVLFGVAKFIFSKLARDKNLFNLIEKINPSIVLLPSHAFEGLTFEIIRAGKQLKIPSFMLIQNWDTLANRTLFPVKPDYLGVWSQQQFEQAISIMGMAEERVFILGAPRLMHYFSPGAGNQPSPFPFRYVLYGGMADRFDELGALRQLDQIIERRNLGIKIVYRPTPTQHTRNCPDVFFEYDFKHVILDTPAKAYYKKSASWDISADGFNPIYYPDLNYYPRLFSNMEYMICSHTTMMIEAPLFGKRVYALAYDDGRHPNGPHWAYKNFRHLFGLERVPNVRIIRNQEDVEKIFSPGDRLGQPAEPLDIDYFISKEATKNHSADLKKSIDKIMLERCSR